MPTDSIIIKGAREHNLKNINLTIPRDKLVVFTGLSGSGKSSLAFDTLYAEGQRRYVESLSSYARQFLGQMEKPEVDSIDGLSPAISIDQKTTSKNPRSTVGTVTEIHDYMRLLYARIGVPHCTVCGREIRQQTVDQIVDQVMALPEGSKILVMSPVARGKKGEFQKEFESARKSGFVRARVDGSVFELTEQIKPDKNLKHNIEIVVDRLVISPAVKGRLTDSAETALTLSGGLVLFLVLGGAPALPSEDTNDEELVPGGISGGSEHFPLPPADLELLFSQSYACPEHGVSVDKLEPRMFSFNNPFGACKECTGLGFSMRVDPDLVVPDGQLSLNQGAIHASGWNMSGYTSVAVMYFSALAEHYKFSLDTPFEQLSKEAQNAVLFGTKGVKIKVNRAREFGGGAYYTSFEGVINNLERRYRETSSDWSKTDIESVMSTEPCAACKGARLCPESLAVTVGDRNIDEVSRLSVVAALDFYEGLALTRREHLIGDLILKEIRERLGFLKSVGLDYLTLSRSSATLSGGESQRIRLATQIGSSLMGVLYILDEPSIGLHQRDNEKLLATLRRLRNLGNTLIVVEHDEDTMFAADRIVDFGPGAGIHGGEIVAEGTADEIMANEKSETGNYLSGRKRIPVPEKRRSGNGRLLTIKGAKENNLKNVTVKIPLGAFVCVTGVSGSGKSSLVNEIIYKRLAAELNRAKTRPGAHSDMTGIENLDKIIDIDQSPIGRTPRSNPATYTGVFNDIRELYAATPDSKARGYASGRFSFNVKGGRCEACQGDGIIKIEMNFLPDIYVPCEVCGGKRYNRETLEVKYKGKSIHEVLEMTVAEAVDFFESIPRIKRKFQTLQEVGLGYIKAGQPATTLSGGEAQRVKLATELSKRSTGKTIYILDEPTTGLHAADVHMLIEVLNRLVEIGNTVLVIEHNLDVIKVADHIIDLGPEGGDKGGSVVVCGVPEEVAKCGKSYTGKYLKDTLDKHKT